jgi:PBP1b-binding outer membrane lipoprotein LpoB
MKYLSLLIIVLISGCSSQPISHQIADVIFEKTFEKATNTDISYSAASCPNVKRTCSSGNYQEWYQKNGKKACACNK